MDVALLGATGSIGTQTLDAVRSCLPGARVRVLTGNRNLPLLAELIKEFSPDMAWVPDGEAAGQLAEMLGENRPEILTGAGGLIACASESEADVVVNALVGRAGLAPTLAAIQAGKNIALANKESLVTAGALIMPLAREKNVLITPIDSEHSAILQCLENGNDIEKIILTASGGPFRTLPKNEIAQKTAQDALKHPNWKMGPKITIDSATMMNKGLEYIEALWLFDVEPEQIEIVVHPQSIIHSMVQFADGAVMAQMGLPDMRLPILYALAGPRRVKNNFPRADFTSIGSMTFEPPDEEKFPCLRIAKQAAQAGGTAPAVMNAVNEWAVHQFLQGTIGFYEISAIISQALQEYTVQSLRTADDVARAENWAEEFICTLRSR